MSGSSVLALIALSLRRLKSRLSLAALFMLSASLAIGLLTSVPVFADAVSQRIMQEELGAKMRWIGQAVLAVRFYSLPSPQQPIDLETAASRGEWIEQMLRTHVGLPVKSVFMQVESPTYHLRPQAADTRYGETSLGTARVVYVQGIAEHVRVVNGEPFGAIADPDVLNVWITDAQAKAWALQPGEVFELGDDRPHVGEPLVIQVVGFWEPADPQSVFWYRDPNLHFENSLLTTAEQYEAHIYPAVTSRAAFVSWYYVLDDAWMNLNDAEQYITGLNLVSRDVALRLPRGAMDFSPIQELADGQQRKTGLTLVLLGFSVPLFGILVHFMASISGMLAQFQEQEIAILASRGATRMRILKLVVFETGVMLLPAIPVGIGIGMLLAHLLGYSLSFLAFVQREPLRVHVSAIDYRMILAALGVAFLARLVTTWRATRFTMVTYEHRMARYRPILGATWLLFIGMLVAVTYYAHWQLSLRGSLGLITWQVGGPANDPLLLLAPTLFLLTAPLIAMELFQLLVRPLAWLGRSLTSFSGYVGLINLGREGAQFRTPVYMLVLALGLGIFYASLAKSADIWMVDHRRHQVGADLTFRFPTEDEVAAGGVPHAGEAWLLPIDEYNRVPGVAYAAPVAEYRALIALEGVTGRYRLLGVDRMTFPNVVHYRSDYSRRSLGELMNLLGATPNGILVPSEVAEQLLFEEGDLFPLLIVIDPETRVPLEFTVVGTFDHFPTMYPDDHPVLLTNLSFLEMASAHLLAPTGLWVRMYPGYTGEQVLEGIENLRVSPMEPNDLPELLDYDRERLERVGVFGMLSVSFLAGALLSGLGLLVYSFASMMRRSLRFAVLQALGAKRSEIISIVSIEYLATLLYSIVAGVLVGVLSARLYVPYFPLTDYVGLPIPPFIPYVDWNGARLMAISMAISLVLIEIAALWHVLRMRTFETLRLGTRE